MMVCGISFSGVSVLVPVPLRLATIPSTGPHADSWVAEMLVGSRSTEFALLRVRRVKVLPWTL
ncbi:hypothetical protein D3C81_2277460 [compost metagenome]